MSLMCCRVHHILQQETADLPSEAKYRAFVDWLHENHQHYVPLIDAAIGKPEDKDDSYDVYTHGHELDVFIKHPNGQEFVGEVWPG